MCVCVNVCNTITLETLDRASSVLVCRYVSTLQGIQVKFVYEGHQVKVNGHSSKNAKFPIRACKTSIGNNSGSVEESAVTFVCSVGFSDMADRTV